MFRNNFIMSCFPGQIYGYCSGKEGVPFGVYESGLCHKACHGIAVGTGGYALRKIAVGSVVFAHTPSDEGDYVSRI